MSIDDTIEAVSHGQGTRREFLAAAAGLAVLLFSREAGTGTKAKKEKQQTAPKQKALTDDELLRKYSRYQNPLRVGNPLATIKPWGAWGAGRRGKFLTKTDNPHAAVDMACKIGTPLYPMGVGKVIYAGNEKDRRPQYWRNGNVVEIETTNGLRTFYAHLSRTRVKTGDYVNLDTIVGYSGVSGNGNQGKEPHVHVQVKQNGVPVKPTRFFSGSYYTAAKKEKERYVREFRAIEQQTKK
ncbi:MAG: M23 family metallopeptidase [Candidatus Woesearchaeota archaeon]|nr:M23 family metallopeptidase [Candidatus Woesearchaeota archaeon]